MCFTIHVYSSLGPSTEAPVCTVNLAGEIATIAAEREEVVSTLRDTLSLFQPTPATRGPARPDDNIDTVYRDFASVFNRSTSTEGRDRFITAVDEIFSAYRAECAELPSVPVDFTQLANSFRALTRRLNTITAENITQARAIYGRFLCYNEREESSSGLKRKRQTGSFIATSSCTRQACPAIVTNPCQFFACLSVSVFEYIAGFGNVIDDDDDYPCIGFVVDTTGSMSDEIAAARRVILQVMRSQADSTVCYLLVPFNDISEGHPLSK